MALIAVLVGHFNTYQVMNEMRESVIGERSTPFLPSKAARIFNMRGESSSSFSRSSTLSGHGTCLTELIAV